MTLGGDIARARKAFYNPMLKKNPCNYDTEC